LLLPKPTPRARDKHSTENHDKDREDHELGEGDFAPEQSKRLWQRARQIAIALEQRSRSDQYSNSVGKVSE